MLWPRFSPQNVDLLQLHVPAEEENQTPLPAVTDCTVSLYFFQRAPLDQRW